MILLDVNVCIYAFRQDYTQHDDARAWLTTALEGAEAIAVADEVLAAVVRITTNHRTLRHPATAATALAFCDAVRAAPAAVEVRPTRRRWEIFSRLVDHLGLRGNDVPDAFLAALALEHGATLATFDRGFNRFPGLSVLDPGIGVGT